MCAEKIDWERAGEREGERERESESESADLSPKEGRKRERERASAKSLCSAWQRRLAGISRTVEGRRRSNKCSDPEFRITSRFLVFG